MKEEIRCKINPKTGEYDCKDNKGDKFRGSCKRTVEGNEGGINVLGNGISGGRTKTKLNCHDDEDFRNALKKKYKNKEIVLEDY